MLRQLSGRNHPCTYRRGPRRLPTANGAIHRVHIGSLRPIRTKTFFVSRTEGLRKAGAYAIQGRPGRYIPRIEALFQRRRPSAFSV